MSDIEGQASSNSDEWFVLKQGIHKMEIDEFIQKELPPSIAYQTNHSTYCLFCVDFLNRHKAKTQLRKCKSCQVKYSIKYCAIKNIGSISQKLDHDHEIEDSYNNTNGLPQVVKIGIDRLLETNPKLYPRQIRAYINNNFNQLGLQDVKFDLNQAMGYASRQKAKINPNDNRVQTVENYLGDHLYFETININQPFFFGFNANDRNVPIIGNGTKISRLYVFCTTIKILQMNCNTINQNGIALFHIDGTYKITKEGYPMLVFGRSNPNRKIYPIVVGLVSSEEQVDFEYFFNAIIGLCTFFGINMQVRFLMQDAQSACSAAARLCFPGVHILMCWFHLKQAIKTHITKSIEPFKQDIEESLNKMHYSSTLEEFEAVMKDTIERWQQNPELNEFIKYFTSQWINSQWVNWKLFSRPIGFSTTNNNTEGFNKIIKQIYTNYERTNVLGACKLFEKMLTDLSKSQDSFELKHKRDNILIIEADKLSLSDFQFISSSSANRILNGQVSCQVYLEPKYCSCKYFLEFGICKHYIALRKLSNKEFDEADREFAKLKKKGRPPKSNNGALNKD